MKKDNFINLILIFFHITYKYVHLKSNESINHDFKKQELLKYPQKSFQIISSTNIILKNKKSNPVKKSNIQ